MQPWQQAWWQDVGSSSDSGDSGSSEAEGKVYYLNFKPEADEYWQELAEVYTEETGVEVTVLTAASGEYEKTLNIRDGKDRCAYSVPGKRTCGTGKLERLLL